MSSITIDGNVLVYRSDYAPALVAALKATIPATDRRWDGGRKAWLVAPQHGQRLVDLTAQHLRENIGLPKVAASMVARETRILEVRYLGATKDRGDGAPTAFGLVDGEWAVVFSETVLREWFNAEARPDEVATLYAVLGVPPSAPDIDIKAAYRRMAKMWHPDVSQEPQSEEQFKRINRAYEVLRDPDMRARYNAGMALEASLRSQQDFAKELAQILSHGYRSPLRCGLVMAEGREVLARFVVEKVLTWSDITDARGRILVPSWPMGAKVPVEAWV